MFFKSPVRDALNPGLFIPRGSAHYVLTCVNLCKCDVNTCSGCNETWVLGKEPTSESHHVLTAYHRRFVLQFFRQVRRCSGMVRDRVRRRGGKSHSFLGVRQRWRHWWGMPLSQWSVVKHVYLNDGIVIGKQQQILYHSRYEVRIKNMQSQCIAEATFVDHRCYHNFCLFLHLLFLLLRVQL